MDLDELERMLREATAGPWFVYVHTGDGTPIEPGDDWTIYGKDRAPVVFEGGFSEHAAANAALRAEVERLREAAQEFIRDYIEGDMGDIKSYVKTFRDALQEPTR